MTDKKTKEQIIDDLLNMFIQDSEFIYDDNEEEYYIKLHKTYYKLTNEQIRYLDERYDFYEYVEVEN